MEPQTPSAVEVGRAIEEQVCAYLRGRGLSLITRNYRCRQGELDLIMRDNDTVVFVEVRFRRNRRFGGGAESVDRRKRVRLVAAGQHYLQAHPKEARHPCRFDVVAVTAHNGDFEIDWIRNAIES